MQGLRHCAFSCFPCLQAHLDRRLVAMLWPILRLQDQCLSACLQGPASADVATLAAMEAAGCTQVRSSYKRAL